MPETKNRIKTENRSLSLLLAVVAFVMVFCSSCKCGEQSQGGAHSAIGMIEGYTINNLPIDHNKTLIAIEELESFFGDSAVESGKTIYLDDINAKYPIEYLRKTEGKESYYIAYPVLEGGQFLVFLNMYVDLESSVQKLVYAESIYIHDLPDKSDFFMDNGMTYEEIKAIAPCTILSRVMASAIESYSCFADGWALVCTYQKSEDDSLILQHYEFVSSEDSNYPFSGMILSDLAD